MIAIQYLVEHGHPLEEWEASFAHAEDRQATEIDRFDLLQARFYRARIRGRPGEALGFATALMSTDWTFGTLPRLDAAPWRWLSQPIEAALAEPGWDAAATDGGRRLEFPDPSWGDTLSEGWINSMDRLCYAELARVIVGDTSRTGRSVATLRALRDSLMPRPERSCPELIDALWERGRLGARYASGPTPALARLDSLMRLGPKDFHLDTSLANLLLARLYWESGDVEAAAHWVERRASGCTPCAVAIPAWLRSQGRFAAAIGDTAHAVRAYEHYLRLRPEPEPALVSQRDSVLAELACVDPQLIDLRAPGVCERRFIPGAEPPG